MNAEHNGEPRADRNGNRARDRRLGYLQLVLAVAFIAGAFILSRWLASMQSEVLPDQPERQRSLLVQAAQAAPQSYRLRFEATATVQVRAITNIVPQVSGRVMAIDESAFPGGAFTSKTTLFRLEQEDYQNEVQRLKAEVSQARTQLQLQQAATDSARSEWRQLHGDTPVPPLVAEIPQLKEARAVLQSARAGLSTARLNLNRTRYRLPFDGRIIAFEIERGQYVVAGQSYGQAYRTASREIDVPLTKQELTWLQEASSRGIKVSRNFESEPIYTAHIKRIAAKVDPRTRLSRVVLGLNAAAPDLVPDVFVKVRFVGPERSDVWVLPLEALQEGNLIWTISEDNTLQSLQPTIIQINARHAVAQSSGKTIRVVTGYLPEATEGAEVRIVENESDSESRQAVK